MNIINPKNYKAFALSFGFFALSYLTSCRETGSIDPELVPGIDNINTFGLSAEDMDIRMKVVNFDSQVTSSRNLPLGALGRLEGDPFFGDIYAGFFMQFTVPSVGYSFPEDVKTFDSVRIVIPYTGVVYGDTTGTTAVEVFEINDPSFIIDTTLKTYYSFSNLTTYPTPIGSIEKRMNDLRRDTLVYSTTNSVVSQLVIPLNSSFLSKMSSISPDNMHNHYSFVEYLNGVYIKAVGSSPHLNKSLHYFLLSNSSNSSVYYQARLEVHFTKNDGSFGVTMFPYNNKYSSFFSKIERNDSGYPVADYADNIETDSFIIQGGPGLQTEITINNLDAMIASNKVYAARLTINMPKTSIYDVLAAPAMLLVNGVNDDGTLYNIADYQTSIGISATAEALSLAQQFVGGRPVNTIIDGQDHLTYHLNIPREIQRHLGLGKNSIKLRIYPYYDYIGAYRFIAPGFKNGTNAKAQFNIIYGK